MPFLPHSQQRQSTEGNMGREVAMLTWWLGKRDQLMEPVRLTPF